MLQRQTLLFYGNKRITVCLQNIFRMEIGASRVVLLNPVLCYSWLVILLVFAHPFNKQNTEELYNCAIHWTS